MPSSNKTAHLALNKWLGSDKPKKDDFNSDNALIDAACRNLAQRVDAASETVAAGGEALSAHTADAAAHVTAAERAAWNAGRDPMVIGTYVGNGAVTRKIPVSFPIRFGMLYAVGKGSSEANWTISETRVYYAYFGKQGSSRGVTLNSDGFTVAHTLTKPADGCMYKYNETDVTYVYVLWPDNEA